MRTLFITGVSRGLGQALSTALSSDDTRIVGFGRSRGEFVGDFHSCDFTKPQLAARIFEDALANEDLESATSIVFISNAGRLGPLGSAQDLDAMDIEQNIAANLCGSALAASLFLRRVSDLDTPKVFAQISSGAALPDRAKGSWSLYCASKAGQEQLVRAIAREQERAARPTKFININPGIMETAMQVEIRNAPPDAFPEVAEFIKMSEEGRIPTPEAVAEKIRILLSDIGSIQNGKTYTIPDYA